MTAVVSDTSPINYLCVIEAIGVLPSLFDEVIIPPTVLRELQHPRAPRFVQEWLRHLPAWVGVRAPATVRSGWDLDPGETEAITLALELRLPAILMDERDGCLTAEKHGLQPIGTLAILVAASTLGLLDLESALLRLRTTNFHIDSATMDGLIAEARSRKS